MSTSLVPVNCPRIMENSSRHRSIFWTGTAVTFTASSYIKYAQSTQLVNALVTDDVKKGVIAPLPEGHSEKNKNKNKIKKPLPVIVS